MIVESSLQGMKELSPREIRKDKHHVVSTRLERRSGSVYLLGILSFSSILKERDD